MTEKLILYSNKVCHRRLPIFTNFHPYHFFSWTFLFISCPYPHRSTAVQYCTIILSYYTSLFVFVATVELSWIISGIWNNRIRVILTFCAIHIEQSTRGSYKSTNLSGDKNHPSFGKSWVLSLFLIHLLWPSMGE